MSAATPRHARAVLLLLVCVQALSHGVSTVEASVCKTTKVLVLGAGMAGISAAKTFSDNGTTDFIILEARDEIGGRVWSRVLSKTGVRVELGANWIQGIDPQQPSRHPLWKIAQQCGGIGGSFTKGLTKSSLVTYDHNGENITNDVSLTTRLAFWNNVTRPKLNQLSDFRYDRGLEDISVRTALDMVNWTPVTSIDKAIEWMGTDYCIAEPPERSSLLLNFPEETYSDFGNVNRTIDYFITDQEHGYVKIVDCLASEFLKPGDERLHLSSNVSEIHWTNEGVCVNTTENGTKVCYCAPFAVLTFSIGSIRFNKGLKFFPPLPTWKSNLLARVTMALYLKIFLEFNDTFWDTQADFITHIDEKRGYFINFQSLSIPGKPSILFTTVTGDQAQLVYNQTVEKTTNDIMTILRGIYGESVPDPLQVTIPPFGTDPLYNGMYSFQAIGWTEQDYKALGDPVGRLYFSGEATSANYSAFVHGAYFSGIDTANVILRGNKTTRVASSASSETFSCQFVWPMLAVVMLFACLRT